MSISTRNMTEENITRLALERYGACEAPRLRQVMTALVTHLHAFIREVEPTEAEWLQGIDFLTRTGRICDERRQEFILLSDVLGVSMLVDAINHRSTEATTPTTVMGPFHVPDSPRLAHGGNMAAGAEGEPVIISGTVRSAAGLPIAGAVVDVWQSDAKGVYEAQLDERDGPYLRAAFTTNADGAYLLRTVAPLGYTIPLDGPVGMLTARSGISPFRPSHIHFDVSAPGFSRVITHLFRNGDPHLDDDVVFAVKDALVVDFHSRPAGVAATGDHIPSPYYEVRYDFVLRQAEPGAAPNAPVENSNLKTESGGGPL